jgi:NAD(P)H-hydrate epimerase
MAHGLLLPRAKFANKGTYGHALLVCGSRGMMGAAVLATGGALRSGCGLVTTHVPDGERSVLYCTCPSAILSLDPGECFTTLPADLARYSAIGTGCGLGQNEATVAALAGLLESCSKPMVLDADALNILAAHPHLQAFVPAGSILTPHPGELKHLVGEWADDMDKIARVREFAASCRAIVVVKGAHTMICAPSGECYFNPTGTPAMAKGGSGDVLTGLLTGLLARGYEPLHAALLGVYLHGRAGELAAQTTGEEALCSSDIIDHIGDAFRSLVIAKNE